MKQIALFVLTVSLFLTAGCSKTDKEKAAAIMEDQIEMMEEMTSILKTVTDEESAKAAEPKLKKLSEKFQADQQDQSIMENLSEEDKKELVAKYEPRLKEVTEPFMQEMMRVMLNPKLNSGLGDVLQNASPKQ
jgi:hypothetical protein